jgi:outer membrane protein OmpA-like peptidoglycan-associated protein
LLNYLSQANAPLPYRNHLSVLPQSLGCIRVKAARVVYLFFDLLLRSSLLEKSAQQNRADFQAYHLHLPGTSSALYKWSLRRKNMRKTRSLRLLLALFTVLALGIPAFAQEQETKTTSTAQISEKGQSQPAAAGRVTAGQKQKISGVIVKREGENIVVRDYKGAEYNVNLSSSTKIKERKSNPFRGAKKYEAADLARGLAVEVEGRGNDAGALVADQIKFSEAELRVASSIESRVTPVEGRVSETETRMTQAEQNAQRLSGQIEELTAVANTAQGGAKAAQETADKAMTAANSANERITATSESLNSRISSLDDFEVAKTITINFKVGSAALSPDAKAALDEIAEQAKSGKGHVIQVAGFASADGSETLNRRLSQRRAEAVMSYLIENHDISQRRIITPLGYGEARAVADNTTRDGRKENRRVEVAILVSKGLTASTPNSSDGAHQ